MIPSDVLDCARRLAEKGFEVPDWNDLAEGKVPGDEGEDEPKIGWQKQAANSVEECFFSNTAWPRGDSERALALSHSGPLASPVRLSPHRPHPALRFAAVSYFAPSSPPSAPSPVSPCQCGRPLDAREFWGERGGLSSLQRREYVVRQARACAPTRSSATWVCTTSSTGDASKCWRTLHGGAQLAIDTTMVSPLHRNGVALRGASSRPGVALNPELAGDGGRARLVVLAAEVGGRWSAETAQFLSELASAKVRDLPEELQDEAALAWHKRWSSVVSCAAAKSFALSLLDQAPTGADGQTPSVHEVLRECRFS